MPRNHHVLERGDRDAQRHDLRAGRGVPDARDRIAPGGGQPTPVRAEDCHPDDVRVDSRGLRRGRVLEVRVHPEDLGKVIGRGGRTARALRTVMGSLAGSAYVRVDLLDTDEIR